MVLRSGRWSSNINVLRSRFGLTNPHRFDLVAHRASQARICFELWALGSTNPHARLHRTSSSQAVRRCEALALPVANGFEIGSWAGQGIDHVYPFCYSPSCLSESSSAPTLRSQRRHVVYVSGLFFVLILIDVETGYNGKEHSQKPLRATDVNSRSALRAPDSHSVILEAVLGMVQ
ncbi:hypothetical protein C0993_004314 [Termitomyces sp. T159_Od127]|nr:hypothetical protein C0993_004314 [Termitomyces sp. T159_Od127]